MKRQSQIEVIREYLDRNPLHINFLEKIFMSLSKTLIIKGKNNSNIDYDILLSKRNVTNLLLNFKEFNTKRDDRQINIYRKLDKLITKEDYTIRRISLRFSYLDVIRKNEFYYHGGILPYLNNERVLIEKTNTYNIVRKYLLTVKDNNIDSSKPFINFEIDHHSRENLDNLNIKSKSIYSLRFDINNDFDLAAYISGILNELKAFKNSNKDFVEGIKKILEGNRLHDLVIVYLIYLTKKFFIDSYVDIGSLLGCYHFKTPNNITVVDMNNSIYRKSQQDLLKDIENEFKTRLLYLNKAIEYNRIDFAYSEYNKNKRIYINNSNRCNYTELPSLLDEMNFNLLTEYSLIYNYLKSHLLKIADLVIKRKLIKII